MFSFVVTVNMFVILTHSFFLRQCLNADENRDCKLELYEKIKKFCGCLPPTIALSPKV